MDQVVKANLRRVKEEIARAARRVGRDPAEVQLVAVSKGVPVTAIRAAQAVGQRLFGENRVQEFVRKYETIGDTVDWHFIGYLQRNKVKYLVGRVKLLHSLDRWDLAVALDRWAQKKGQGFEVLLQVNVAREPSKHGLHEEEVPDFLAAAAALPGIRIRGLMTIAPFVSDPEEVRPVFRRLRELATAYRHYAGATLEFLSMGMSGDYVVAVEEGANLLRIGTAIFGPRRGKGEGEDEQKTG
ncbi:YggS family pyridoxal phosphate-dependent enzyme [Thermodesulfitimonas sp.]